jgi:hypothetical protein
VTRGELKLVTLLQRVRVCLEYIASSYHAKTVRDEAVRWGPDRAAAQIGSEAMALGPISFLGLPVCHFLNGDIWPMFC